jgi:hypothetical protein
MLLLTFYPALQEPGATVALGAPSHAHGNPNTLISLAHKRPHDPLNQVSDYMCSLVLPTKGSRESYQHQSHMPDVTGMSANVSCQ